MRPRVRRADGLLHLRYFLPNHIYCSAVYPRSAPNGSELVVCGHERGLSIIWRGGRSLKDSAEVPGAANGDPGEDNDVIITDGDAESDDAYESEEDEVDPAHPYRPIIQHIEIPIGSPVLHLAFPYLRQSEYNDFVVQPQLLQEQLVVAVACEDRTVRVLTLPLAPPSNSDKAAQDERRRKTRSNDWLDNLVTVSKDDHRTPIHGVSIAFALHKDAAPDTIDEEEYAPQDLDDLWDLLVVSHSAHVSGILHVHRVPVSEDGTYLDPSAVDSFYWQSERLSAATDAVRLTVPSNPGGITWPRILATTDGGPIRIFECYTEEDPDHGQWTATIYPGFDSAEGTRPRQKRVLDAQWAMGGTAVIALLASGEWRMYDVGLHKGQRTLSAAIPSKWALSGWVERSAGSRISATPITAEPRQKLAPMTPSTRKIRSEAFLSGKQELPQSYDQGGVVVLPTKKAASNGFVDETIIMWSGPSGIVIPSFAAYYRHRKDSGDPFSGGVLAQARELPRVELDAEMRSGVSVFAAEGKSSRLNAKHADILVSGERSFVIVASPLQQAARVSKSAMKAIPAATDEHLLAAGDLDVGGLDRMLDSMVDGSGSPSQMAKQRRVGSLR